ncbi:N-acetylmuramoyl-L-alanine amidase [Streptomyces sp. NPDC051940]|uniref:peptidoglycan recognition protein family protein n=1 Tax=Streptomyces sp. NPDC051940 TaxID=3155675 RepID=UPI003444BEA3
MQRRTVYLSRRGALRAGAGAALGLGALGLTGTGRAAAWSGADTSYVIDCAGWGARPPKSATQISPLATQKIVVHHMAFPNTTDYSRDAAIALARKCQDLHMDTNGWIDTGQHFTVSRGGYVLEGRHGSLGALTSGTYQITGAHCVGENQRGIGIENEGTYVDETPPQALWASLVMLCTTIGAQYGLGGHQIFGHWDFNNTQCPGAAFYRQFPALRLEVARGLGQSFASIPARTWPDTYSSSAGHTVVALQYLLRAAGYDSVPLGGSLGDRATQRALKAFQTSIGVQPPKDSTVTPATWEALCGPTGPGSTGEAVLAAQTVLSRKLYAVGLTGNYDAATVAAVAAMQELHGLPATGVLDTASWCATIGGVVAEEFTGL